jgi:hypothetical protein
MLRAEKQKPTDIYEDQNFDHRLDLAVAGAQLFVKDRLLTKRSQEKMLQS